MLERVVILLALALAVLAVWGLARLWRARRLRRLGEASPLTGLVPPGRPAIVAFSTPSCTDCRARQAPTLARLAAALGDTVTIQTLSALDHPALVRQVGVLTVPATVVVDAAGRVRHLNLGYAAESTLHSQVAGLVQAT
jgi:hypothetical protein